MDPTKFTLRRSAFSPGNAIFIVDCLSSWELQTGRSRLQEMHDLLLARDPERYDYNKHFAHRFEARSADEFAERIQEILGACDLGIQPVIFIDAHGDPEKGLAMVSGGFVSWGELLASLRRIVERAKGELTVIVAACHSMAAVKNLPYAEAAPFSFYYGYSSNVLASVLEKETRFIYESLFNDGGQSVLNAKDLQLKSFSEYDHVELALAVALLSAKDPGTLAKMRPEMSRAKFRAAADEAIASSGRPLSGSRVRVNKMFNSGKLAIKVVEQMMHATPRRARVIEDIEAYIKGEAAPPL